MAAIKTNEANSLLNASVDNVVGVRKDIVGALYFLVPNHRVIRKSASLVLDQVLLLLEQLLRLPESESL